MVAGDGALVLLLSDRESDVESQRTGRAGLVAWAETGAQHRHAVLVDVVQCEADTATPGLVSASVFVVAVAVARLDPGRDHLDGDVVSEPR